MTSLTLLEPPPVKFHMMLNVRDMKRSIAFYRVLFGVEPAKEYADYAKFETDVPPTIFSLAPIGYDKGGPLSHIGLRMTALEQVWAARDRLEKAGIPTRTQEDTGGCYARQTKIWADDPDGNTWEVYIVTADLGGTGSASAGQASTGIASGTLEVGTGMATHSLMYKGPMKEVMDAGERVFHRGRRTAVPAAVWEDLRLSPAAEQFIFYAPTDDSTCGH